MSYQGRVDATSLILDEGVGDGEVFVECGDAGVEFGFGDDEGRGDDEVRDPGLEEYSLSHHFGGDLIDDERLAFDFVAHGVEELLGFAVLDDFDGEEEAEAADVADGWMFCFEGFEFLADVGFEFGGAFDELEALHLFDGGDGGAEGKRVGFVGVAVGEVVLLKVVGNFLGGGAEAEGDVG